MDVPAFAAKVFEYCRLTSGSVIAWVFTERWLAGEFFCQERSHLDGLGVDIRYDEAPSDEERGHITALVGLVRKPKGNFDHLEAPPPIARRAAD